MTVICVDGFDLYNGTGANTGIQAKWTLSTTSGLAMASGRFGGQCVQLTPQNSGQPGPGYRAMSTTYTAGGVGFAFRETTMPTSTTDATICPFMQIMSGANYQLGLKIRSDGALQVYRLTALNAGTLLGTTAAGVIAVNTWHFVEWGFTIHDSTGVITLKVDGVTQLSLTSQDTNNTGGNWDRLQIAEISVGTGTGGVHQFDDLYILDSATTLGERRIETLYPSADVAQGFARSTGSTNYTLVDEAQVNADTDYVQGSSVGDTDTYDFANLGSTPTTIDAVQLNAFAEKTDAASRSIYLQAVSGATTSDGSAYSLAASYAKFERLLTTDPNGGGAWGASAVNALRGGPKVAV